jgi:hypothetical protein
VDVGQHVAGGALAGKIPALHRFLDLIPAATRSGSAQHLRATWPVRRLFAAPAAMRALGREPSSVVQVCLVYPIGENAGSLVKDADGRLPPTSRADVHHAQRFSISLQ